MINDESTIYFLNFDCGIASMRKILWIDFDSGRVKWNRWRMRMHAYLKSMHAWIEILGVRNLNGNCYCDYNWTLLVRMHIVGIESWHSFRISLKRELIVLFLDRNSRVSRNGIKMSEFGSYMHAASTLCRQQILCERKTCVLKCLQCSHFHLICCVCECVCVWVVKLDSA